MRQLVAVPPEAKLKAAMGKFKFHVLMPDLEARGLGATNH